jgi:hypothetical protein
MFYNAHTSTIRVLVNHSPGDHQNTTLQRQKLTAVQKEHESHGSESCAVPGYFLSKFYKILGRERKAYMDSTYDMLQCWPTSKY